MHIYLLDELFKPIIRVPGFTSFIWSSCYSEPGSFELYIPYDKEIFKTLMTQAKYILRSDTKKLGYIQSLKKDKNTSKGSTILLSGPQLEGVLQKYVFMGISFLVGGTSSIVTWLQNSLKGIFPLFVDVSEEFGTDLNYTLLGTKIISSNAQALIYAMLKYHEVSLTHEKQGDRVVFRVWKGRDRSISQPDNPILLSEKMGNICNIQYQKSEAGCYNMVLGTGYTNLIEQYRDNGLTYFYPPDETANRTNLDKTQTHFEFDLVVTESQDMAGNKIYQIDEPASHQRFLSEAPKYLVPISESFTADLLDDSLVELGDIVSIKDDDTGMIFDKRVEKIVESYNPNDKKRKVTFGDSLRTIKNVVTKSMGME